MGQVRCDHCGWSNNPEGAKKCQKCNQDLVYLPPVEGGKDASFCNRCGYPLTSDTSFCPNCGNGRNTRETPREIRMNENKPESAGFRLRPIDVEAGESFAFGGDTDAVFEFVNGQWCITDRSGSGSTYVSALRSIPLKKGDIVLMGGRRYVFE